MLESTKDILEEIDTTINQLLENEKILKKIEKNTSFEEEASALQKTQESLIAHLIHMDTMLKRNREPAQKEPLLTSKVHEKLGRSGYLNQMLCKKVAVEETTKSSKDKPKIHKRKVFAGKLS